ncbi:MAG: EAL domain-containing protein [Gammaproteobacteria bacterium]|nr:EAL domain-containing protein [Gammaproteobacteria bacterium]
MIADLPAKLVVSKLASKNTLNQNTIEAIHEDSFGFMWFATQAGLHFYDGRELMLFTQQTNGKGANGSGLVDNFVIDITSSSDGRVWALSLNGLSELNRDTMRFKPIYQFSDLKLSGAVKKVHYHELSDAIYFFTDQNLYLLPLSSSQAQPVLTADSIVTMGWQANTSAPDALFVIKNKNQLVNVSNGDERSLPANFSHLVKLSDGYVGLTDKAIVWLDNKLKISHQEPMTISWTARKLIVDREGILWFSLTSSGLVAFDFNAHQFRTYSTSNSNLEDFSLRSIFVGEDGLIWLGTATKGVYQFDSEDHAFNFIEPIPNSLERKIKSVRAVSIIEPYMALATDGGVVINHLTSDRQQQQLNLPRALAITNYGDRGWFVGTEKGIYWVAKETQQAQPVAIPEFDKSFASRAVLVDSDELYIATDKHGVIVVDVNTFSLSKRLTHQRSQDIINLDMILSLFIDSKRRLWVGTIDGLQIFELGSNKPSRHYFDDYLIRDIAQSNSGRYYLATHSGIIAVDNIDANNSDIAAIANLETNHTTIETSRNNNPSIVYSVYPFEQRIWYSSNKGVGYYSESKQRVIHFDNALKLGQSEFNGRSRTLHKDRLYFGGLEGVTEVTHQVTRHMKLKPTWITEVAFGDNFKQKAYFPHSTIYLGPFENVLNVKFSSTNFDSSHRKEFRYRINRDNWKMIAEQNELILGGLEPGQYALDVEFRVDEGEWLSASNNVNFEIEAKFYETTLAKIFYFVIILGFIAVILYQEFQRRRLQRKALKSLESSEERLKLALQASEQGLWDWKAKEGKVVRFNIGHLFHVNGDATEIDFVDSIIHDKDRERVDQERERFFNQKDEFDVQYRVRSDVDRWSWIHDKGKVIEFDEDGQIVRAVGTYTDITNLKRAQLESVLSNEILQSMTEGVVVLDNRQKASFVNPAFSRITGYSAEQVMGLSLEHLQSSKHSKEFYINLWMEIERSGSWYGEFWIKSSRQKDLLCSLEAFHIDDDELDEHLTVLIFSNITDKRLAEEKLSFLARYDSLTGLPNRNLFLDRLEHAIALAKRQQHRVAVFFIDLDGFKKVNDSFGHQTGDLLLKRTADLINQCVRDEDTLARLSGDEFLLIVEDYDNAEQLETVANKVLERLRKPIVLNETQLVITCSIGIAEFPNHSDNVESLLKFADTAMYYAKNKGKNSYSFYQEEMHADLVHRLSVENYLRDAVVNHELYVLFQPIIESTSKSVAAAEALVRWRHPQLGEVFPGDFIPLAEETGHIVEIGGFVFEEVCRLLSQNPQLRISVSVNVSVRQLMDDNFVIDISRKLEQYQVNAEQIKIEITESLLMTNPRQVANVLSQLKELGLVISVDDFGTGYSSLSYLKRFAIDELKIDKEFISDIRSLTDEESIVNAILAMAKSLNMQVVAEGVETEIQVDYLTQHDCELLQGFWFSKPLEQADFLAFIASREQQ